MDRSLVLEARVEGPSAEEQLHVIPPVGDADVEEHGREEHDDLPHRQDGVRPISTLVHFCLRPPQERHEDVERGSHVVEAARILPCRMDSAIEVGFSMIKLEVEHDLTTMIFSTPRSPIIGQCP